MEEELYVENTLSTTAHLLVPEENLDFKNLTLTSNNPEDSQYFVTPDSDPAFWVCKSMVLKSELMVLAKWRWWLLGIGCSLFIILGLAGNIVAFILLQTPSMKSPFNQLLMSLCIFDALFLVSNITASLAALNVNGKILILMTPYFDLLGQISMCCSVLMMVALTLERHFAICSPHAYRIRIRSTPRWKHLSMYIVPVTIVALFLNIPMFFNLDRSWMANVLYVKVNLFLRAVHPLTTTGLAPVVILILLNIRIRSGMKVLNQMRRYMVDARNGNNLTPPANGMSRNGDCPESGQRRHLKEIRTTHMACAIVFSFIALNLPRVIASANEICNLDVIIYCIENNKEYINSLLFFKFDVVARTCMIINSSINFVIYSAMSRQFQSVFRDALFQILSNCLTRRCRGMGSFDRSQSNPEERPTHSHQHVVNSGDV